MAKFHRSWQQSGVENVLSSGNDYNTQPNVHASPRQAHDHASTDSNNNANAYTKTQTKAHASTAQHAST